MIIKKKTAQSMYFIVFYICFHFDLTLTFIRPNTVSLSFLPPSQYLSYLDSKIKLKLKTKHEKGYK